MIKQNKGTLIVTSSTAAVRGNKGNILMQLQWQEEECYAKPLMMNTLVKVSM